ncbi:MAG: 5-(carboxyamino)imidazole ribonucleotide synthase [Verrucomicrobiota bacterium]|nr:5-(carboxyamino)imidazole ribonucleotide synthase [Limisphaera sp.]MDW8380692.1 5-(carboxyamino)imidazole ribonucleotide synthase [Verrucomicrobiota bacterium]
MVKSCAWGQLASPGPRLAVLGGGQLAKMLAQAAARLGCQVVALEKNLDCPAALVCPVQVLTDWEQTVGAITSWGRVDVVTLENEFVADSILADLEASGLQVRPGAATLRRIRDKFVQKTTLAQAGLPVPAFAAVQTLEEIAVHAREWGWPLVLKARCHGYDGKGNATLRSLDEAGSAWARLGGSAGRSLYVEAFCRFDRELAVMVTRERDGNIVTYPVVETVQTNHVCHHVVAPARISATLAQQAAELARAAIESVQGVGTFGVELFLDPEGRLWINELAPRVHNTGHYTIEACECSQFENHVRAVLGWPLGSPHMVAPAAAMVNLLGQRSGSGHAHGLEKALAIPGAHVHIYGKSRCAPGRKMGHVTALGTTPEEALSRAEAAARCIEFGLNTDTETDQQ